MARLNFLLTVLLVACSLLLVSSRYRTTRLNIDVEIAQGQARELDVREHQLKMTIAQRAQESRIDGLARSELKMIDVAPERVLPARELK